MQKLLNKIFEEIELPDSDKDYLTKTLNIVKPLCRSNEKTLNSFHITSEMKPHIEEAINDMSDMEVADIVESLMQLNDKIIDWDNEGNRNNSTLGNAIIVSMINELNSRFNIR